VNIVAFDTSCTYLCAAAEGPKGIVSVCSHTGFTHAERLLDILGFISAEAGFTMQECSAVVCGKGPGSFTGLRIALATAKGLSQGLSCPMVSIPALDAMALPYADRAETVLAIMDARKNRYYGALYQNGLRQDGFHDKSADEWASYWKQGYPEGQLLICGPDAQAFHGLVTEEHHELAWRARPEPEQGWGRALLALGKERVVSGNWDSLDAVPEYIRASDAELGITKARHAVKPAETAPADS